MVEIRNPLQCLRDGDIMFGRLLCLFNRHRPRRDRIEWDGFNYISDCRHCEATVRRQPRGGWRAHQGGARKSQKSV
ncbi:hypothetical protein OLX02_04165 [Novosphingobium sp. KCTC 2891]|nr:hypothetical protein [Novosphingobium sp. KCTC 2891]